MSNGKTHDDLNRIIALPVSVVMFLFFYIFTNELFYSFTISLTLYIGIQLQRFFTPDTADIDNATYSNYLIGLIDPYLERLYRIILHPFKISIPHRHWLSHGLFIGTFIKLLYIVVLTFPLMMFSWYQLFWKYIIYYYDYSIIFIIGIVVGDIGHLSLDFIPLFRNIFESYFSR